MIFQICKAIYFVLAVLVTHGCFTTPSETVRDYGCERPPADTFVKTGVQLTVVLDRWNDLAKEEFGVSFVPEIGSLVSTLARDERLYNYLRCLSIRRDGFTQDQVGWFERLVLFRQGKPLPEEFMGFIRGNPFPPSSYDRRIVLIDSRLRIYDPKNLATNGHQIRELLNASGGQYDIRSELATPQFNNTNIILKHRAHLIIAHLSSFYPWDRNKLDINIDELNRADQEFREFAEYMLANSNTTILVYTRGVPDLGKYTEEHARAIVKGYARQKAFISSHSDRMNLYELPRGTVFTDNVVREGLANKVHELLTIR